MAKKLTVVMIGEDVDERGVYDVDEDENRLVHSAGGYPMSSQMRYGANAMALEYELGHFVVNTGGGHFVKGVYPYFTADGWIDCEDYEKFYFGGLMLKVNGEWYLAPWVNPDGNRYEIVDFVKMPSLTSAFITALEMAMGDYVNKTA